MNGRKSGWDLSGKDEPGVRPQERRTRLSYLLAAENDGDGSGTGGGSDGGDGGGGPDGGDAGERRNGGTEGKEKVRRGKAERLQGGVAVFSRSTFVCGSCASHGAFWTRTLVVAT